MYVHKHTSVSSNKLTGDRVGRTMEEIIRHGGGRRGVWVYARVHDGMYGYEYMNSS